MWSPAYGSLRAALPELHPSLQVLSKTEDLRTSACCTAKPPPQDVRTILSRLPDEVVSKYYGCGSPLPQGIKGLRVLDLGSGSGRDCYVCAALVGPEGSVTGGCTGGLQLGGWQGL